MLPAPLLLPLLAAFVVGQEECPPDSGTDPNEPTFGTPVPPVPEDIPAGCSEYEILSARGTSEIGKFGYRVGDPLIGNVTEILPGSRGYPVQYPASSDFTGGVATGAEDVVSRIQEQSDACPEQTFSLVGYSQGAMVMHSALDSLPEEFYDKVKSVVLFGDPQFGQAVLPGFEEKLLENCAPGDTVCDRSGLVCPYGHTSYTFPEWIEASEVFIAEKFTA